MERTIHWEFIRKSPHQLLVHKGRSQIISDNNTFINTGPWAIP